MSDLFVLAWGIAGIAGWIMETKKYPRMRLGVTDFLMLPICMIGGPLTILIVKG